MLKERLNELISNYGLKDARAVTFGHPKMKIKWILPMPSASVFSFEQFQPFLIYFDNEGIAFFPLDLNNSYAIIGRSFVSWNELKNFCFKKGLLENKIELYTKIGKIEMKIPKSKAMNEWVKENNSYLEENNFFRSADNDYNRP